MSISPAAGQRGARRDPRVGPEPESLLQTWLGGRGVLHPGLEPAVLLAEQVVRGHLARRVLAVLPAQVTGAIDAPHRQPEGTARRPPRWRDCRRGRTARRWCPSRSWSAGPTWCGRAWCRRSCRRSVQAHDVPSAFFRTVPQASVVGAAGLAVGVGVEVGVGVGGASASPVRRPRHRRRQAPKPSASRRRPTRLRRWQQLSLAHEDDVPFPPLMAPGCHSDPRTLVATARRGNPSTAKVS